MNLNPEPEIVWLGEHRIGGKLVARVGRRGENVIAEFARVGRLLAQPNGTLIRLEPFADTDPNQIAKLGDGIVDALLRHLRGELTLHGGAVCLGRRALAFVGPSGAGKSTLAAACSSAPGVALVADDTVALEIPDPPGSGVFVLPTQRHAWLHDDARGVLGYGGKHIGKTAVTVPAAAELRARLTAVISLVFDERATAPELGRVRGQAAFAALSQSAIRFIVDEPQNQVREFQQLETISLNCPVFELRRRRDLKELPRSVALALSLLSEPNGSSMLRTEHA